MSMTTPPDRIQEAIGALAAAEERAEREDRGIVNADRTLDALQAMTVHDRQCGIPVRTIRERYGVSDASIVRWGRRVGIELVDPDRPRKKPAECGTPAGYRRHRNHGEEACAKCKAATAAAERARKAAA